MLHLHPNGGGANIFGRQLESAEVIQMGDLYNSASGKWELVPKQFVDSVVKNNTRTIFIRPAKSSYIRSNE